MEQSGYCLARGHPTRYGRNLAATPPPPRIKHSLYFFHFHVPLLQNTMGKSNSLNPRKAEASWFSKVL